MSTYLRNALCAASLIAAMPAMKLLAADAPVIPIGPDAYKMWDRCGQKSTSRNPGGQARNGSRQVSGILPARIAASSRFLRDEMGATLHNVEISNRRFRDDEFLVPRELTEGKSSIRVRVKFTPVQRPLFPGQRPSFLAWSEFRYNAYSFVMPKFTP